MRRPTEFPTWISVLSALRRLPDDSPVTLASFRAIDAERDWHYAVYQFGPDGPTGPRRGPSPWLAFVDGHSARTVRRLLPFWISHRVLPAINADDLASEILKRPELRHRLRMAQVVASMLTAHPYDYGWLLGLLRELNPDPLTFSSDADVDTENDLPFDHPPWLARSHERQTTAPLAPRKAADATKPDLPPPTPRPGSTRPTLRASRDRSA